MVQTFASIQKENSILAMDIWLKVKNCKDDDEKLDEIQHDNDKNEIKEINANEGNNEIKENNENEENNEIKEKNEIEYEDN